MRKVKDLKLKLLIAGCVIFLVSTLVTFFGKKMTNVSFSAKTSTSTFSYSRKPEAKPKPKAKRIFPRSRARREPASVQTVDKSFVKEILEYLKEIVTSLGTIVSFVMILREKKKIKKRKRRA